MSIEDMSKRRIVVIACLIGMAIFVNGGFWATTGIHLGIASLVQTIFTLIAVIITIS